MFRKGAFSFRRRKITTMSFQPIAKLGDLLGKLHGPNVAVFSLEGFFERSRTEIVAVRRRSGGIVA